MKRVFLALVLLVVHSGVFCAEGEKVSLDGSDAGLIKLDASRVGTTGGNSVDMNELYAPLPQSSKESRLQKFTDAVAHKCIKAYDRTLGKVFKLDGRDRTKTFITLAVAAAVVYVATSVCKKYLLRVNKQQKTDEKEKLKVLCRAACNNQ